MTTTLTSADFISSALGALQPVCTSNRARLVVSTHLRAALDALFDGPGGSLVILVPGSEMPEPDSAAGDQFGDLQIWRERISMVVSHRLPPTATPNQALYESVAGAKPFFDLVDALRDAMREMRMPAGSTGQIWRYDGRKPIEFAGIPMPAFQLDFSIEAAPPAALTETEIAPPQA